VGNPYFRKSDPFDALGWLGGITSLHLNIHLIWNCYVEITKR
jgi:hypothetical protein